MKYVCGECGERFERAGYCARDGKPIVETEDVLLGSTIGRYRVARMVAEGGMGRVYLGVQPAIGSRVAIKVLADTTNSDLIERFFAEARAVNLIRHESIVSVIDMAKLDDGRPYIVMEYIEGQTLGAVVRSGGAPLGGVVQVMLEVLSALSAAHAIGIVHRDLKPDNILVTAEGHAKVLDFGIAKLLPGLSQQLSPRTRTGALLGTPAYMAPEQISGSGNVDVRTDIYAAGIVFYEAVTGRVPFVGETLYDLMRMHLETPPAPPRTLRADLPAALEQVILQALAKDPALRFQSAGAMGQATQHAAAELRPDDWRALSSRGAIITGRGAGTVHPSRPPSVAMPSPPPAASTRRSPLPWIAAMVVTAAIAVIATWIVVGRRDDKTAAPPVATTEPVAITEPVTITAPVTIEAPVAMGGSAPPAKSPTAITGPVVIQRASPKTLSLRADYNPKSFDPVAYLPKALAIARKLYPDAKLTRFDFEPVLSDGRVDLTMPGDDRSFWYRSEAASKRPAGVAPNMPVERPCMIYVELSPTKIEARIVTNDDCDDRLVRDPRCKLAAVWKQAIDKKSVPPDHVAKIGWLFDEKWFFDTDLGGSGDGVTTSFEDRCP